MDKESISIWRARLSEELINRFFVRFIYSSNRIENNEVTLMDVKSVFRGQ